MADRTIAGSYHCQDPLTARPIIQHCLLYNLTVSIFTPALLATALWQIALPDLDLLEKGELEFKLI